MIPCPYRPFPIDGTWPTATTQYEKRNIAVHIPVWDPDVCIQCGTCSFVCPHATIRIKAYDPALLKDAPRYVQIGRGKRQGDEGPQVHRPGGARGLYGMRLVRQRVPGPEEGRRRQ